MIKASINTLCNGNNIAILLNTKEGISRIELINELKERIDNELIYYIKKYTNTNIINSNIQIIRSDEAIIYIESGEHYKKIIINYEGVERILYLDDNHNYFFIDSSKNKTDYKDIITFIDDLADLNEEYKYIINTRYLLNEMRILDNDKVKPVVEDDVIKLVLYDFYSVSPRWMRLTITLKETNEIIGYIEFHLHKEDYDNFSYSGNVSYEIFDKYQDNGYCKRALELVKMWVSNNAYDFNKELFIATLPDNYKSQRVALSCGGKLCYEGEVPKSDRACFLSKTPQVKIYKISNL